MGMDKLISVIGLAPSEIPREELLRKLSRERDRVRRSIIYFRKQFQAKQKPKASKVKKKGGKPASRTLTKMKNAGVTAEDMQRALEQLMAEKE